MAHSMSMIPPSSAYIRMGKRDALAGKPMPARGSMGLQDAQEHEYRMGHIVASVQRAEHPEWTNDFIMY